MPSSSAASSSTSSNIIISDKAIDILTPQEKEEKVIFQYENLNVKAGKEEVRCGLKIHPSHLIVVSNNDHDSLLDSVHFSQRIINGSDFIMFFGRDPLNQRKSPRILKFETAKVTKRILNIIWRYKNEEAGFAPLDSFWNKQYGETTLCPISNVPPITITHSKHDLAAVFSLEEKQSPIKVWTSKNSTVKQSCQIHIDVERERLVIKPIAMIGAFQFEVLFSQRSSRNYDTLTFDLKPVNDNEKLKLTFVDKGTAGKLDKVMENVKAKKKAIQAEKMSLTIALQKLQQEPSSLKNIRKIMKYYATTFTIFKEENRKIALEIFRAFDFHEGSFPSASAFMPSTSDAIPSTSASVQLPVIEIKQEISELSPIIPVRKRSHQESVVVDIQPVIKLRKKSNDEDIIWPPNFEFFCDSRGIPKKQLIIYTSEERNTVNMFIFAPTYRPDYDSVQYSCTNCDKVKSSHHVTAKYCVNEFGENYIKINGKHVCKPQFLPNYKDSNVSENIVAERHTYKGYREINYPRKTKVIPRNTTQQWNIIVMIFTPSKNAYYHYREFSMTGLYYCCECKERDKYVFARLINMGKNFLENFEILDEDHICTPKEYKLPELIAQNDDDGESDDE